MLKVNKKQIMSTIIAVFFVLGVAGVVAMQSGITFAAAPAKIGIVDFELLMSQHPDTAAAQTTMQAAVDQAKQDFDAKSATMTEQEKKDYYNQLQQQLNAKQQELLTPIHDKVLAAIKEIADGKGLAVVVNKGSSVYGGEDITVEVGKKITGQ
ncbi:MAG: outer rane chaperone Skp (OmpH) [Firmicutes bacterium]|nr:outer rane chaperone Skp (OmpH) [Bacillota bacterium]